MNHLPAHPLKHSDQPQTHRDSVEGLQVKNSQPELKVLIVEDSPYDAELLIMRLNSEGFKLNYQVVQTEEDYCAALDQPLELILSDWVLPQFSGLRALQLMRARDLDTPFIIISGTISEDSATEALRLGAYDYLLKDRVHRLGKAVLNALDQKKLRDERKQAEKMLQLQASALNAAANAIVITNAAGAIEWANPAFSSLTGYSSAEATGMNLRELIDSSEHEPAFFQHMGDTLLAGEVWRGETTSCRKDGTSYTEEMTITPIRDAAGITRQFIAIKEDVTQQKLTEKILQARIHLHESSAHLNLEAMLRATIDEAEKLTGSQIGFFHFLNSDQQTISLQAWSTRTTEQFCKMGSFSSHYDLQQAGIWADCIRERKVVVHNQYAQMTNRKNLPERHARVEREVVVPVFRKAKIVAIFGVGNKPRDYTDTDINILERLSDFAWDVIEKKISDEVIRENEDRFRQLAENINEVFWLRDLASQKILYVNPAFEMIWGVSSAELYRQPQLFFKNLHLDDSDKVKKSHNEHWEYGKPFNETFRILRPDGSLRWVKSKTYPVRDDHDEIIRIAGIAEDITDQYASELLLEKSTEELKTAYDATLQGWSNALELREHETAGHSQRVVQTTLKLAHLLGVAEENLIDIQRGALLHDIGKMGIPDNILLKPGPLNEGEWLVMRKHPEYANRLLSIIPYLKQALEIPCCHHEKWDGTGYPLGLKGEDIPLAARIFAIVDVWDALSNDRPYRTAWTREAVVQYIQDQSGSHFDPRVVDEFLSLLGQPDD